MSDVTETSDMVITSKANLTTSTFTWRIEKFDAFCSSRSFELITSPYFTVGEDTGRASKWHVTISGSQGSISCYLIFDSVDLENSEGKGTPKSCQSVSCHFKMSLGNDNNRHIFTQNGISHTFTQKSQTNGYSELISIEKLHRLKSSLLSNRTLNLCVQMEIFGEPKLITTALSLPLKRKRSPSMEVFSTDFQELLKTKKEADVEIVCGGKTFNAHKLILSARSKVFNAMFDSEMKESSTNQIALSDIDTETFNVILEYIYTGKVSLNESTSYTELIYGAEKYDLPELKLYCFSKMLECVTLETIGSLAVAADSYDADEETKATIKKYCQSNIATLWKSPSFQKLLKEHPGAFLQV